MVILEHSRQTANLSKNKTEEASNKTEEGAE